MPLYRRPDPLPSFPSHRLVSLAPLLPKPAVPTHKANTVVLPKPKARVLSDSLLAGVAGALALFAVFVFNLLVAGWVWDSPHRSWFFLGLGFAYLGGAFVLAKLLRRKFRAWRPLDETPRPVRRREVAVTRSNPPVLHSRWVEPIADRRFNASTMALN